MASLTPQHITQSLTILVKYLHPRPMFIAEPEFLQLHLMKENRFGVGLKK